jgi:hypothetical protein
VAIAAGLSVAFAGAAMAQLPNPQDRGAPARTVGGGTRGSGCTADTPISVGLAADGLKTDDQDIALVTDTTNPTFYIQLPSTTASTAELLVLNDASVVVEVQTIPLTGEDATLSLPLFSNDEALSAGATYQWAFSVVCDPGDHSSDRVVLGTIEYQGDRSHAEMPTATSESSEL